MGSVMHGVLMVGGGLIRDLPLIAHVVWRSSKSRRPLSLGLLCPSPNYWTAHKLISLIISLYMPKRYSVLYRHVWPGSPLVHWLVRAPILSYVPIRDGQKGFGH